MRIFTNRTLMWITLSLSLLVGLWYRSFGVIGNFYDYSPLVKGAYLIGSGQRVHADFHSSIPFFPLYLTHLSEQIFGPYYLSLAYSNLVLSLLFFVTVFFLLRPFFPMWLNALAAVTLTTACFLQHGILWHNSIGTGLLISLLLVMVRFLPHPKLRLSQWFILGGMICGLGLIKLNYPVFGIGTFICWLSVRLIKHRNGREALSGLLVLLIVPLLVPLIESTAARCTLEEWFADIVQTPSGRQRMVWNALGNMNTLKTALLGKVHPHYRHDPSSGLVGISGVGMVILLGYLIWHNRDRLTTALMALFVAIGVWGIGVLNVISNVELQIVTGSFLLAGCVVLAPVARHLGMHKTDRSLTTACLGLCCLYFLGISLYAISYRARLNYSSGGEGMLEASPDWPGTYFKGVRFRQRQWQQTDTICQVVKASQTNQPHCNWFFGPSLEYCCRLAPPASMTRLPLWWHAGVSWNESQVVEILHQFQEAQYDYVALCADIGGSWHLPPMLQEYLEYNYETLLSNQIGVVCLRRLTSHY